MIYEPSDDERTQLAQVLEMPGWEVVEQIIESELARFDIRLKNLDAGTTPGGPGNYEKLVLEYHREAKVAAMVYQAFKERIATERTIFNQPKPKGSKPTTTEAEPDITEGIL
jgi:hypothetical protein